MISVTFHAIYIPVPGSFKSGESQSGESQGISGIGVDFRGGEAVLCSNVGKADQRLHQRQLSGMIELEAWNAFAIGQNRGLGELEQLSAVHE